MPMAEEAETAVSEVCMEWADSVVLVEMVAGKDILQQEMVLQAKMV